MRLTPFAVLLLSVPARALAAQAPTPYAEVQPGARVRVEAPGIVAGRYVGTVLTRTGDTLTLGAPTAAPITLPLGRIQSLEISRGKSRSAGALRGVAWGAPIGLALGAFAVAMSEECTSCEDEIGTGEGMLLFTVSGVLWGAGIGALIGRERWDRFQIAPRTSLRLDPRSRMAAVVVRR